MVSGRSSGKSSSSHSGPYGATVMTSFSWFSGNSESSWKCMVYSDRNCGADRRVEFRRVGRRRCRRAPSCGRRASSPAPRSAGCSGCPRSRRCSRSSASAPGIRGSRAWRDQVVEQFTRAGRVVDAEAHVLRRVVVDEVGGEGVDEQNLLAGLRVGAHHRDVRRRGSARSARAASRSACAAPKLASMLCRARRPSICVLHALAAAARRPAPCSPRWCRRRPAGVSTQRSTQPIGGFIRQVASQ